MLLALRQPRPPQRSLRIGATVAVVAALSPTFSRYDNRARPLGPSVVESPRQPVRGSGIAAVQVDQATPSQLQDPSVPRFARYVLRRGELPTRLARPGFSRYVVPPPLGRFSAPMPTIGYVESPRQPVRGAGVAAHQVDQSPIDFRQDPAVPIFSRFGSTAPTRFVRPTFSRTKASAASTAVRDRGLLLTLLKPIGQQRPVSRTLGNGQGRASSVIEASAPVAPTVYTPTATIACTSAVTAALTIVETMGTTLTSLQAGSLAIKYTVAISGYPRLLTDASSAAADAAWAGTDREGNTHVTGIFVDIQNQQELNPWEPFNGGGKCRIYIPQDSADLFGIDVNKRNSITEMTFLDATLDRNDTTATVKSTANFAASGTFHVGTEAITYSGKTATTFTGCARGKYPALEAIDSNSGAGWADDHTVNTDISGVAHAPEVTVYPRRWPGRWVSVWAHRVTSAGVLDVKGQAQLIFAGRLVGISDSVVSGQVCTVLDVEHALDGLANATVGRDMWTATIREGLYLSADSSQVFELVDTADAGGTLNTATPLTIVAGAATAPYEVNEGFYTHDEIIAFLNAWLAQAVVDGDIKGSYSLGTGETPQGFRTKIWWIIPGAGATVWFKLGLPGFVAMFLGFAPSTTGAFASVTVEPPGTFQDDVDYTYWDPDNAPLRHLFTGGTAFGTNLSLSVEDQRGTFTEQDYTTIPLGFPAPAVDGNWGIFLVDNRIMVVGSKTGSTIDQCYRADFQGGFGNITANGLDAEVYTSDGSPAKIGIRQIFAFDLTFADVLRKFLFSTGTTGYNDTDYDVLPKSIGLGIPGEIIYGMRETAETLPDHDGSLVVFITEPTKFASLISGECILRHVFPRWKDQQLEFRGWKAPSAADSAGSLGEVTKAAPIEVRDDHRTVMVEDDVFARPVVKIDYNRDLLASSDSYRDTITFYDQTAYDDCGGTGKPFTIQARNTYAQFFATGASVEELAPSFLALLPLFSRPMRRLTRSIDMRYFEGYSVGDIVLISDNFARNPETGLRGLSANPAIILKHTYTLGGLLPGNAKPSNLHGEIDLMVLDADRTAQYCPSAQVDIGAANGGLDAGTSKIFTCLAHACSESTEAADASYFTAGMMIRIVEIDPATAGSPLAWSREVASQTGNTITVTAAIAAPAWDATKHYRIGYDDHSTQITAQRAKCSQADDADYLVQNVRVPFTYNAAWPTEPGSFTANAAADQIELPADETSGDGKALDVGTDMALVRLTNNLIDLKTAHSSPVLGTTQTGSGATGTWKLSSISPIFLTAENLTNVVYRVLTVAPFMRSSDGSAASVRVSLQSVFPQTDSVNDVALASDAVSATFSSSSTTWGTATADTLDLRVAKNINGLAWLLIECSLKAETRGLAICQESERTS